MNYRSIKKALDDCYADWQNQDIEKDEYGYEIEPVFDKKTKIQIANCAVKTAQLRAKRSFSNQERTQALNYLKRALKIRSIGGST